MMTNENYKKLLDTHIRQQGNQVDLGSVLPEILGESLNALSTNVEELRQMRDNGELITGAWYRVPYEFTTTQENTRSAGHKFDILVMATSPNTLSEDARAVKSERDREFIASAELMSVNAQVGERMNRCPDFDGSFGAEYEYAWGTDADLAEADPTNMVYTLTEDAPKVGELVYIAERMNTREVAAENVKAHFAEHNLNAWRLRYTLDDVKWSQKKGVRIYTDDDLWFERVGQTEINGVTMYLFYNEEFEYDEDVRAVGYLASPHAVPNINEGMDVYDINTNTIVAYEYSTTMQVSNSLYDGFGTILWLKDENENECIYDFKNAQFLRGYDEDKQAWSVTEEIENGKWFYTFSKLDDNVVVTDASVLKNVYSNKVGYYMKMNNNLFVGEYINGNVMLTNCYNNTFGNNCQNNTFGNYFIYNTFGNDCYDNTFGNYNSQNTFGNNNSQNTFGNDCQNNTFGNYCYGNTFGNYCYGNTFGNYNSQNTFGNNNSQNTFGNDCQNNTFGNNNSQNTFGNNCQNNTFGNNNSQNTFGNNVRQLTIFEGITYVDISGASGSSYVKNAQILNGTSGTSSSRLTISFAADKNYTQIAAKTTAGALKIWNPADLA